MRLTVIYNPKAGSQGWPKGAIEERLRAAGHDPILVSSKTDWRPRLAEPAEAFVAAGGDGTVHKLARALAGTDHPMAILPMGTANNLARAFGYVPGSDPFASMPKWGEAERTLRIECAQSDGRTLPLLEVAGAGAFARLLLHDDGKKRPFPIDSLLTARRRLLDEAYAGPPLETRATVDGEPHEGRFVMLACMRTPSFGPALWLAPEQRPDVPELTLVGVRNDQREAFAWWLATGEGDIGAYRIASGRSIQMDVPGPIHVDDNLLVESEGPVRHTVTVGGGTRRVRVLV